MRAVDASAWQVYLHAKAQTGNEEALAALRKLDGEARAAPAQSITGTIFLDDDDAKRRRRSTSSILKTLTHSVERNGDISYRQHGRTVLRDEGLHLAVLDENSEETIAAALLLGREKFGTNLTLTGSPEFQRRVVAVAVAQGIPVKFVDPQLEAIRQHLADEKYMATRTPARPVTPPPPSNKSAQRAVDVPDVDPHQVAAAAAQPTAHEWLVTWSAETGKTIASATPERGDATHTVVHVAPDGVVINKGSSGAVYPVPIDLVLKVGDRVIVDRSGDLSLARTPEQGAGKNVPSR